MTEKEKKKKLAELDANIAEGERLQEQGFDCEVLLAITLKIREDLANEAS